MPAGRNILLLSCYPGGKNTPEKQKLISVSGVL